MVEFIVVGGANTETIMSLHRRIQVGEKHSAHTVASGVGGGGVNQAARLRKIGHTVHALLPLGKDATTQEWTDALGTEYSTYSGTTSHTIVGIDDRRIRTAFSIDGTAEDAHADDIIERVDARRAQIIAAGTGYVLLVGHIRRAAMETTKEIVKVARDAALRCVFPGRSQFTHCYHEWKDIWLQIDYFQLEFSEAQVFVKETIRCGECKKALGLTDDQIQEVLGLYSITATPTLEAVLRFFQTTRMTAGITLNQKGAVAVLRDDEPEKVFIALPYIVPGLKDPTGAGDAFGAGVASRAAELQLEECNPFSSKHFCEVLDHGTLWGALACLEYGGAAGCLSAREVDAKRAAWASRRLEKRTLHRDIDDGRSWLYFLGD